MKISEIISVIESVAPLSLQEQYDNSGLIVGNPNGEITSALLCVDITESVLDEAIELGAGLIIAHHPIIFHPLKRLTGQSNVERIVARAICSGVALYAAHTNLDQAENGLSVRLANLLGVKNGVPLAPAVGFDGAGYGVVGTLGEPMATVDFLAHLKSTLNLSVIRHSDLCCETISRVAISSGSGASLIKSAVGLGADIFVTADLKYNDFVDATGGMIVADVGHFESEYCAIEVLFDIIRKKMTTFALHRSVNSRNPVEYYA